MIKVELAPRRACLDYCKPVELAIDKAMEEVENMPADVRLTEAVIKLWEARDLVSDFIDEEIEKEQNPNGSDGLIG